MRKELICLAASYHLRWHRQRNVEPVIYTIMENKEFQHPEGKIQLLNGKVLDCYPLEQPQDKLDNQLALDTTGVYFSVGKKPIPPVYETDKRKELDRKAFLENAFLFIENRDRILSDSRMFLCPVPVTSGLAYSGTSGFNRPTLGIYLEWWRYCANANIMEDGGDKWLVYQIAGSPLSGSNRCGLVNHKGETKAQQLSNFISLWPSFQQINCRYDDAKCQYQAYSLREVLDIFQKEGRTVVYKKDIYIYFLEQENKKLRNEVENLKKYGFHLYQKLRSLSLNSKRKELEAFLAEYQVKCEDMRKRLAEIQMQRLELRRQMREGIIDNRQYQRLWMPIHKEKDNIQNDVSRFEQDTLREMFPDFSVSVCDVERFLKGEDNG